MNFIRISLLLAKKLLAEREVFPIREKMFYLQFSYEGIERVGVNFKVELYILWILGSNKLDTLSSINLNVTFILYH